MEALKWARTALIGTRCTLPTELLALYPELVRARYRRGGLPLRLGGWFLGTASVAGITVGKTIWLHERAQLSAELLLHELCHVHQFHAVRGFPLRYVWESIRSGYRSNRFEIDARTFASARLRGSHSASPREDV